MGKEFIKLMSIDFKKTDDIWSYDTKYWKTVVYLDKNWDVWDDTIDLNWNWDYDCIIVLSDWYNIWDKRLKILNNKN